MKTAEEYLRPRATLAGPGALIPYDVALAAVQAVIDHYEPVAGLELLYRVKDQPPPPARVFPAACPRCLQRGADCLCGQAPF